jgi:hypothetical protein
MWKLLVVFSTVVLVGCASEDADSPPPELEASCGPVTFESVPPGPDEFPPLDTDAQSALDELVNGLPPLEAAGFEPYYQWSIASRTDEQLVLFGQGETLEAVGKVAEFGRGDGEWTPTTWGTCQVVVRDQRVGLP